MAEAAVAGNVTARRGGEEDGGSGAVLEVTGDEYRTATASLSSSTAESSTYLTAGMDALQMQHLIETSREQGTCSERKDGAPDGAAHSSNGDTDAAIWEELKSSSPHFFRDYTEGSDFVLGKVIAGKDPVTIYEAKWLRPGYSGERDMVAKVLKGYSLADLRSMWPRNTRIPPPRDNEASSALLSPILPCEVGAVPFGEPIFGCSTLQWATLLKDGRFLFMMERCWGDLRSLIDLNLKKNNDQGPPFPDHEAVFIMLDIALGVKMLHERGILHRDLKAQNILVDKPLENKYSLCEVADYDSSPVVIGTGFWRAPEVLRELSNGHGQREVLRDDRIWTEKVDIYGYAMTCYEVLTGKTPFPEYTKSDWNKVINDRERPHFPGFVDPVLQRLVEMCWAAEPSQRPHIDTVGKYLLRKILGDEMMTLIPGFLVSDTVGKNLLRVFWPGIETYSVIFLLFSKAGEQNDGT